MPNAIAYLDESTAAAWERAVYAFLAEKERRSGSLRTSSPTLACSTTSSAAPARHRTKSLRRTSSPGRMAAASLAGSRARSRSAPASLASAPSIVS